MSNGKRAKLYHVGRKTRGFDALDTDLVVVEYASPVSPGKVSRVEQSDEPGQIVLRALDELKSLEGPGGGFRAFSPRDGEIYLVEGVEYAPVKVSKYVHFDLESGYRELTREEVLQRIPNTRPRRAAPSPKTELRGTSSQILDAEPIRKRIGSALKDASREDLLPSLYAHTYAAWYIRRDLIPLPAIVEELEKFKDGRGVSRSVMPEKD